MSSMTNSTVSNRERKAEHDGTVFSDTANYGARDERALLKRRFLTAFRELSHYNLEADRLRAELRQEKENWKRAELEVQSLRSRLLSLESELRDTERSLVGTTQRLSEVTAAVSDSVRGADALVTRHAGDVAKIETLKLEIDKSKDSAEQSACTFSKLTEEKSKCEESISETESRVSNAGSQAQELESSLKQYQRVYSDIQLMCEKSEKNELVQKNELRALADTLREAKLMADSSEVMVMNMLKNADQLTGTLEFLNQHRSQGRNVFVERSGTNTGSADMPVPS